jgi:hypothetical protein
MKSKNPLAAGLSKAVNESGDRYGGLLHLRDYGDHSTIVSYFQ